jgi:hypothetical protein
MQIEKKITKRIVIIAMKPHPKHRSWEWFLKEVTEIRKCKAGCILEVEACAHWKGTTVHRVIARIPSELRRKVIIYIAIKWLL